MRCDISICPNLCLKFQKVDKGDGTRQNTRKLWRYHFRVWKLFTANGGIAPKYDFHNLAGRYLVFLLNLIRKITHSIVKESILWKWMTGLKLWECRAWLVRRDNYHWINVYLTDGAWPRGSGPGVRGAQAAPLINFRLFGQLLPFMRAIPFSPHTYALSIIIQNLADPWFLIIQWCQVVFSLWQVRSRVK